MLLENLALVNTSVFASSKRGTQARHKNVVKMVVKFIRKGIQYNMVKVGRNGKKGVTFSIPHAKNGSEDSKWWPSLIS
jgi:hypothetical protein